MGYGALAQGVLSPAVASGAGDAFYETGRTLRLGILSRMEPVTAVAATLGWYATGVLLIASAQRLAGRHGLKGKMVKVCAGALAAAGFCIGDAVPAWTVVGITVFGWIATPLWTEKRNFKKDEKRC